LHDFEIGWEIGEDILFESKVYGNPTDAMQELNYFSPSSNNWFATMRMMQNREIIEEEIFDSSVVYFLFDHYEILYLYLHRQ
jgi:hypothetical protein